MWSSWSFSQGLKPKIQSINGKPHFCFSMKQSKLIATYLEQKVANDSLIEMLHQKNATLENLVKAKNEIILKSSAKAYNLRAITISQETQIEVLRLELKKEKRKLRKQRFFTKTGTIIAVVLGILIVT